MLLKQRFDVTKFKKKWLTRFKTFNISMTSVLTETSCLLLICVSFVFSIGGHPEALWCCRGSWPAGVCGPSPVHPETLWWDGGSCLHQSSGNHTHKGDKASSQLLNHCVWTPHTGCMTHTAPHRHTQQRGTIFEYVWGETGVGICVCGLCCPMKTDSSSVWRQCLCGRIRFSLDLVFRSLISLYMSKLLWTEVCPKLYFISLSVELCLIISTLLLTLNLCLVISKSHSLMKWQWNQPFMLCLFESSVECCLWTWRDHQ